jgi:hypothetical protein
VQAESEDTARPITRLLAHQASHVDILVGCWKASCQALVEEGLASMWINSSGTTVSTGRNLMQVTIGQLELRNGRLFEYTTQWDEDIFLCGYCDEEPTVEMLKSTLDAAFSPGYPPGCSHVAADQMWTRDVAAEHTGSRCYRQVERWVLALMAPFVVPAYEHGLGPNWGNPSVECWGGGYAWTPLYWVDGMSNFIHRRTSDAFIPYDIFLEHYSIWTTQAITIHRLTMYFGAVLGLNLIHAMNPLHRDYNRGDGAAVPGHPCSWGAEYMLQEHIIPPSLQQLVRWDCAPCGNNVAPQAWPMNETGSLSWINKAGQLGSWEISFEVGDAALANCSGTGLTGSTPFEG